MKKHTNIINCLSGAELDVRYSTQLKKNFTVTDSFINRLGLYGELDGHTGCVNCLEWNEDGRLLASGSDDVHINLWDPFRKKQLVSISSGHQGNIFSVKFVPNSGDSQIISGAADHCVHVHDIPGSETLSICSCHSGRVKRLATDRGTPYLFWSAGEDGLILQHDLREPHTCLTSGEGTSIRSSPTNVLIDLKSYMGNKAETKCLAVNPIRPEMMAVGANDPFVRVYDRRMIKIHSIGENDSHTSQIPAGAAQYFVPGHLPTKVTEYKRKYRSLASTYVAFSPDGQELLVNLGGEQIYLFPVYPDGKKGFSWISIPSTPQDTKERSPSNGYKNGHVAPTPFNEDDTDEPESSKGPGCTKYLDKVPLPSAVDSMKNQANEAFERKLYGKAIHLYNEALSVCPDSPLLIGNRGAALLKRAWDGDVYAALKDCWTAITLDPDHFKAHLRLCRCLFELSRFDEAIASFSEFKKKFPRYIHTKACQQLEADLVKALKSNASPPSSSSSSLNSDTSFMSTGSSASSVPMSPPSSANSAEDNEPGPTRNFFIRFSANSDDSSNDNEPEMDFRRVPADGSGGGSENGVRMVVDVTHPSEVAAEAARNSSTSSREHRHHKQFPFSSKKLSRFHVIESEFQGKALDFSERYCGHCNTTTDIKEANFFGNYIVAGSDDGSFFIWDRKTTNIVKVLRGDDSIVNCLQPHPTSCFMATSGIESIIRLWAPLPEDDSINERVVSDWTNVASANQKRMNTNPFEMILMNMGYRVSPDDEPSNDDDDRPQESAVQCNTT